MTEYLETDAAFVNVRLAHIRILIELLRESAANEQTYLRRRYAENALYFDETLSFLAALGCVKIQGTAVLLDVTMIACSERTHDLIAELIRRLFCQRNPFWKELRRYVSQFRVAGHQLVLQPHAQHRGLQSHLRNLLMEMAVISHEVSTDGYVLNPGYYQLFRRCSASPRRVTPELLQRQRAKKDEIGASAEIFALEIERQRVGQEYAEDVEHVALVDATAGFDIASITVGDVGTLPRLIEVKAVPVGNFRFYWSANEITTARRFGPWYFLYLVPVLGDGKFDIDGLQMISDPCRTVLDDDRWNVIPEAYKCELSVEVPQEFGD